VVANVYVAEENATAEKCLPRGPRRRDPQVYALIMGGCP
jgi:hypothetical protein